jgi:outer membrane protein OmpA-like peptidoglycan-associated protein
MSRRRFCFRRWTVLLVATAALGCGPGAMPKNLKSAQDGYAKAKEGSASELAPAQLDTADQALEEAHAAFERGDDPSVVDDLVYIAEAKTALAVSAANREAAVREAQALAKRYSSLQEQRYESAEASLQNTKERLKEEQRRLKQKEREAAERAKRDKERLDLAAKQGAAEVARVKAQLATEKKARAAAEKRAAAALASLAEIAKVKEEKRGVVITMSGAVLFATGKHKLLPIAKQKLADVAKALKDQGYKKIVVEGHTDSRGAPAQNEALSLKRAQEVRSALISEGIAANKIEAVGHGSRRPIADNKTPEGRANNRRVEMVVTPE